MVKGEYTAVEGEFVKYFKRDYKGDLKDASIKTAGQRTFVNNSKAALPNLLANLVVNSNDIGAR